MLKRHRSSEESLPHDVIELILVRLSVKSLLCFKSVSKRWFSTIDSRSFQQLQLILCKQSRGPDFLLVSPAFDVESRMTIFVLGSSVASTVSFRTSNTRVCFGSCDGLVCAHSLYDPGFVINPATGWHQSFPFPSVHQLLLDAYNSPAPEPEPPSPCLGFGKDKVTGIYKIVVLYNSYDFGLDNVTTCEVFDFCTNAWRYVLPSSPLPIISRHQPVYCDGSLHWLTECPETKVLSFDLHTETFQVVSKAPFFWAAPSPSDFNLCILDNRLCVSKKSWPTQVIWSFDSSCGNNPWKKMCTIDLTVTLPWFGHPHSAIRPVAILEKNKLLLHGPGWLTPLAPLVVYDLHTNSYESVFTPPYAHSECVYYFESLVSP